MSPSMDGDRARTTGQVLVVVLIAGWLLGLGIQVVVWALTGWTDVLPPSILLGLLLCAGAGALERLADAASPRARRGAAAGMTMMASIVIGYAILVAVVSGPASDGAGGETMLSLLLEAPLWIGVPALTGAVLGAFGWLLADRYVG